MPVEVANPVKIIREKKKGKLVKSPPFTDGYWNVVLAKVVLFVSRAETGGKSNVSCA